MAGVGNQRPRRRGPDYAGVARLMSFERSALRHLLPGEDKYGYLAERSTAQQMFAIDNPEVRCGFMLITAWLWASGAERVAGLDG
jgi:hypothetical protein